MTSMSILIINKHYSNKHETLKVKKNSEVHVIKTVHCAL